MKRCPTCHRPYEDDAQRFCANDGTPLVADETPAFDPEATVMSIPRPQLEEQPPTLPPTQYYTPSQGPGSPPEQNQHQSYPPPQAAPGGSPAWPPPQQQQQQPYYPQPGAQQQPAPQWQGGQPQPPPWMPPGQSPPGQNWGGGGYYPQPPGQPMPYGAQTAGDKSNAALAALILGIVAFGSLAAAIVIRGTRTYGLYEVLALLGWLMLITSVAGLVLGIIGLITSRAASSKVKAGIGLFLSIIPLLLFLIGMSRRL